MTRNCDLCESDSAVIVTVTASVTKIIGYVACLAKNAAMSLRVNFLWTLRSIFHRKLVTLRFLLDGGMR